MSAAPTTEAAGTGPVVCDACGTPASAGARFCEECGNPVTTPAVSAPPPDAGPAAPAGPAAGAGVVGQAGAAASPPAAGACPDCGGEVDADGYCTQCGAKAPRPRDHLVERPAPWVGAVSDRGRRHHRNEDAIAVAADPRPGWAALVVCDGVSTSEDSDVASLAAARAALEVLVRDRGAGLASGTALTALAASRLEAAAAAAAAAVEQATTPEHRDSPPSCTFVAALVDGDRLAVGSVGDSRAYWLPDVGEPRALTTDDSWAQQQIAAGVPRAEAESGPQAHAITRWLGVDAHDQVPTVTHHDLDGPGWLLLCSDGLWNYASEAAAIAEVAARAAAPDDDPLPMAEEMVRWANEQGGADNISVALARIGTRTHEGDPA